MTCNHNSVSGGRANWEATKVPKRKQNKVIDDLRQEVDMIDIMLSSLVDVLEERRVVRHSEWEKRIKERLSSK